MHLMRFCFENMTVAFWHIFGSTFGDTRAPMNESRRKKCLRNCNKKEIYVRGSNRLEFISMKGVNNLIEIGSVLTSHECDYTHHNFTDNILYLIFFNVHTHVCIIDGDDREMCFYTL